MSARIAVNSRQHQLPLSGIPLYIEKVYEAMGARDVVFLQTSPAKPLGPTRVQGPAAMPQPLFDLLVVRRLARRAGADVLHGPANLLPLWRSRGMRYVVTVHDLTFLTLPAGLNQRPLFNLYYKHAVRRSLAVADAVIADSEHTARDIVRYYGLGRDKIHVVPLGVDATYAAARDEPPLIPGRYFLSLANHPRRKNIARALEAFAAAGERLAGLRYVIVGISGPAHRAELETRVAAAGLTGRVVLRERVTHDELINLYQHARWLLYPSLYEGFGLPVLEAMLAGCPVVVSEVSSLPEVVGDVGIFVTPTETDSIVRGMVTMATLDDTARADLVARSRARAAEFTWTRTAEMTAGVLGA